jgi:hypothetical protein
VALLGVVGEGGTHDAKGCEQRDDGDDDGHG